MKISNAARLIFWLAAIFAIGFLVRAESGERRASMPNTKSAPPIRIFDQNGQPAVSGVPSATSPIVDVTVGPVDFRVSTRTQSTSRWATRCGGRGPVAATASPAVLLARADSQFCSPNDTNCFPGILSNPGTVYQHTFCAAWQLFLHLHRALRSWHDRRGQCYGWLRAVGLVSRQRPCQVRVSDWLAFISRPTGSFTPWAVAPPTQLAASSLIRLNTIRTPILGRPRQPPIPTTW